MFNFDKVEDVLENYKSAIFEKDVERFLATYGPEIHIYDCWGKWESKGFSPLRDNVEEWFDGLRADNVSIKVDFNDLVVEENINLAFIHCSVTFSEHAIQSGEKLRQMTNRFTFCLRKENESWFITHEHSSLPLNMETGKAIFNLR